MKVSGIAIGQWNANCKKKEGARRTIYKIHRAIVFGNVSHVFESKDYVVRYYDMNILVSHTGLVMMVWRDQTRPNYFVSEEEKAAYNAVTTHKENIKKANQKHHENLINIIKKQEKMKSMGESQNV